MLNKQKQSISCGGAKNRQQCWKCRRLEIHSFLQQATKAWVKTVILKAWIHWASNQARLSLSSTPFRVEKVKHAHWLWFYEVAVCGKEFSACGRKRPSKKAHTCESAIVSTMGSTIGSITSFRSSAHNGGSTFIPKNQVTSRLVMSPLQTPAVDLNGKSLLKCIVMRSTN